MAFPINPNPASSTPPALVYDGSCGFCSRSVQFILRHERRHDLLFVTRDSDLGKQLRRIHGMESVESMLWVEDGRAFAQSDAVIKAACYIGGWWARLASLGSLLPPNIRNRLYKIIAKHRRRLSPNPTVCKLPSPEERRRFSA